MNTIIYPIFQSNFIRAAILLAFWAGINMGTHVAFLVGFNFPLGPGYHAYIQTHGYIQLMGWLGLFIMGVSIHFLSRLAHLNTVKASKINWIYRLMVSGLILRFISHSFLPYFPESIWYEILGRIVVVSANLITIGIVIYISFLFSVFQKMTPSIHKENRDIRWFIILNIIGWIGFTVGTNILTIKMVLDKQVSLMHNWHLFLVDSFILFTILPICFGMGLRSLPLFMRLAPIRWNVKQFTSIYSVVVVTIILVKLVYHFIYIELFPIMIYSLNILKDGLILWFVYKLDIVFKTKPGWTESQNEEKVTHKKEPRIGMPDYGEFGRFEWLIRSAFVWLSLGAILDIMIQMELAFKIQLGVGIDGVRHMYLAGFISLLIMGMAVRMIPGMTGAMRLNHPKRVAWLAILINGSVLFRTLSIVLPESFLNILPNGSVFSTRLFGVSGILFMIGLWVFYSIIKPVLEPKTTL